MFDKPLMLLVDLAMVDTIHPKSNQFVTGVKVKVTGDSKRNDNHQNATYSKQLMPDCDKSCITLSRNVSTTVLNIKQLMLYTMT